MTVQEIINAISTDPTSDEALNALNGLVEENNSLRISNQDLTSQLAESRRAYIERFINGSSDNSASPGALLGDNKVSIESLFKS